MAPEYCCQNEEKNYGLIKCFAQTLVDRVEFMLKFLLSSLPLSIIPFPQAVINQEIPRLLIAPAFKLQIISTIHIPLIRLSSCPSVSRTLNPCLLGTVHPLHFLLTSPNYRISPVYSSAPLTSLVAMLYWSVLLFPQYGFVLLQNSIFTSLTDNKKHFSGVFVLFFFCKQGPLSNVIYD